MNAPVHDHQLTAKQLISTFFRECEGEFSRLAQNHPSGRERCDPSNLTEIDWFINQTSELLSSLRTLRNSLVPVNRIPPEIITSIITYRLSPTPDLGQYEALSPPAAVCRYWRNAICSFPSLWTIVSDVYRPQLRRIIFERSKAAPLHVSCLRPTDDGFMEDVGEHTSRIKTLQCRITFCGGQDEPFDDAGNPNEIINDFKTPSDSLKTLLLHRSVIRDMPETFRFGIIPANPKALRTLELRKVPLTIQLTQLTTVTNFVYSNLRVRSELLIDFLASNTLLEDVTIECLDFPDPPNCGAVLPLDHLRRLSLRMGQTVQNLLQCLRLPSTSRVDLFMNSLAEGKLLRELLPASLDALPGIAKTTLLQCRITSDFHLIVIGSNPDGGTITVRGHPTQLFAGKPVDLRPLNLGTVREFVLTSRTRSLASTWTRFRQTVQEMSGVETLVVGSRVALHDLPVVLKDKDSFPNLSAITLVTPSPDEISAFVSSVLVRIQTPGAKRIEFLEVLCLPFDEDHLLGAVKRPLEGRMGLVEVRVVQDADDIWVKSIKRTIDRDGFFR
ncbi:hypothetical protein BJ322DRAFT_1030043 [Thelephora terrestris]|uniref:F-box domain-containing protein n=1 Tax=Thelephora terrestris TaxID=56493 RepID=A0A9P6LCJ7_9AGAM|nr:hypothetical protein BJ322DRAFT_1030043 [Thelephora terrestris]